MSKGYDGADAVMICAGTLRGDTVYGPGQMHVEFIIGTRFSYHMCLDREHHAG